MCIYGDLNNTNKYIVMRSYFYFIEGKWRNKSKSTAPPRTIAKYSVADPGGMHIIPEVHFGIFCSHYKNM